jgi:hypothetical protein
MEGRRFARERQLLGAIADLRRSRDIAFNIEQVQGGEGVQTWIYSIYESEQQQLFFDSQCGDQSSWTEAHCTGVFQ